MRIGALVTIDELAENADVKAAAKSLADAAAGRPQPADPQHGDGGRRPVPASALLVFPQGFGLLAMKDGKSLVPDGENQYHAIFGGGPAYFVSAPAWVRR